MTDTKENEGKGTPSAVLPADGETRGVRETNAPDMINFLRVAATLFVFFLHGRAYVPGLDGASGAAFLTSPPAWAGVWILFFLSGYLMEKGFRKGRYEVFGERGFSFRKLIGFCAGRFVRIAPAYYLYLFFFVLLRGNPYFFSSPSVLLRMLTFTFNGEGGSVGIGHLWYLSPAMWLYVTAPFFDRLLRMLRLRGRLVLFFSLAACGMAARWGLYFAGADWNRWIYTFLPMNLDLFFCGMLAESFAGGIGEKARKMPGFWAKAGSLTAFFALVVCNCYIYHYATPARINLYRFALPTAYILICSLLLLAFDSEPVSRKRGVCDCLRNPLRLIDAFASKTYEFYIFHIAVFEYVAAGLALFSGYAGLSAGVRWCIFFGCSFALTLLAACLYSGMLSAFSKKRKAVSETAFGGRRGGNNKS